MIMHKQESQVTGKSSYFDEDAELRKSCQIFSIKVNYQNTELMMSELAKLRQFGHRRRNNANENAS